MSELKKHEPGVRLDGRTGQYFPTVDGIDQSPTSFEEAGALRIASRIAIYGLIGERNELRAALINLLNCEAYGTKGAAWKNSAAFARSALAKSEGTP